VTRTDGNRDASLGTEMGLDEIHDQIRDSILQGELAPGTLVSQVALARELGVGRTPLREALRMLQREGLIEAETNRRVRVAPFSVEDLEQLYSMRVTLEALACRSSVPQLTAEDLDEMEIALVEMDECIERGDVAGWRDPHRRFHYVIVRHAGERLVRTVTQLSDHAERYRHFKLAQDGLALSAGRVEHRAIAEACKAGDAVAASNALAQHLARTALTVMMMAEPGHEPVGVRLALTLVMGNGTP
jgi:DNA-binding GntR family transcriptional regulator